MQFGWAGEILDINLSNREVKRESIKPYIKKYIGGRILASRLAWEKIPSGTGAFHPNNRIIISTGPLSGTIAPTSGRTIMSMISPVPYPFTWYTHSTLGGWFAAQMKYAGYDVIMIHGKSCEKVYIKIIDEKVEIVNAEELWRKDVLETQEILKNIVSPDSQVLTIGQAGENLISMSTVHHDFDCAAGHSGFGAVWGSKNLKALVVMGTGNVCIAEPQKLLKELYGIGKFPITPAVKFALYENQKAAESHQVGPVCSQSCVNNCQVGRYLTTSDSRTINSFCIVHALTKTMQSKYKQENADIEIPEVKNYNYEKSVVQLEKYNRLGIDFWTRVTFQNWFTVLIRAGINEIDGHNIDPDNADWFSEFIDDLAYRKGLGELFSNGLARALDKLEGKLPEEMIRVGREIVFGFGFQAHREGRFWDKEPLPFWVFSAMMYISETRDPTIGSHSLLLLADLLISHKEYASEKFRSLSEKVWENPMALEPGFENKAPVAIWCQREHFLNDSFPMCDFAFPMLMKYYKHTEQWLADDDIYGDLDLGRRIINSVTGKNFSSDELDQIADRGLFIERCMLARAGRKRIHEEKLASHFRLPCRDDGTFITEEDFLKIMDEFYEARGWSKEDGWPLKENLIKMGLEDVALELEKIRKAQ